MSDDVLKLVAEVMTRRSQTGAWRWPKRSSSERRAYLALRNLFLLEAPIGSLEEAIKIRRRVMISQQDHRLRAGAVPPKLEVAADIHARS